MRGSGPRRARGRPIFGPCHSRDDARRTRRRRRAEPSLRCPHGIAPPAVPARRRAGLRRRRRAAGGRRRRARARPRARPIRPGGRPSARLLTLTAAPSRPAVARFAPASRAGRWPGRAASACAPGGPGGHYAALRDNTTLETPPLAVGPAQQVLLITARAPVGAPLAARHGAAAGRHAAPARRPAADGELGHVRVQRRRRSRAAACGSCSIRSWAGSTRSIWRAWGRASRSRRACASCAAPRGGRPACPAGALLTAEPRAVRAAHRALPRRLGRRHRQRLDPRHRRPAGRASSSSAGGRPLGTRDRGHGLARGARPDRRAARPPRLARGRERRCDRACSSRTSARCSARPRCASCASCRAPRTRRRAAPSASS